MSALNKDDLQDKTLIFLHIPKAAGSTLHQIIERQYEPASIFSTNGNGRKPQESIAEFKELPEARRRQIRVLKGHMKFGLHEYLPQPSTYITMLREPVERVISLYHFIRLDPRHDLHQEIVSKHMDLHDFVCSGITKGLNNGQTRLLSGVSVNKTVVESRSSPTEILENAKKNLQENFAVVGLSERFDETLFLLKQTFNWKTPFYIKKNVTKKRLSKEEISQETLSLIEQLNELDIELYKYAEEKFEELINQPVFFSKAELEQFKLLNKTYGKVYSVYFQLLNKAKLLTKS